MSAETLKLDDPKGWVVVAALFLMLSVVIAARSSIGLMMPFWNQDLGWSIGFISTAGAVMLVLMAVFAPIGGFLIDYYGYRLIFGVGMSQISLAFILCAFMNEPWQLILLFSVIGGIGFAIISPSLVATAVAQFFNRKFGLAASIATAGSTGGQLALMPLLGFLVVSISWRPSFVYVGLCILFTMFVVQFLVRGRPPIKKSAAEQLNYQSVINTLAFLLRDRTFWLLAIGFFICGFTTVGAVKIHLIPYAVFCGFLPLEGTFAYGILSAFSLVGMILCGHYSDKFNRPALLATIYFMRALTFILLLYATDNLIMLYVFAALFGIFDYATFPIVASLVATNIGRKVMGVSMGMIFASHSFGAALGSFSGGFLFEIFNRYDWAWIVSFGLALIAAILSLIIRETRNCRVVAT